MQNRTIAVLGGTGKEGRGLAYRWAKAGLSIIIGSRDPGKAEHVAGELRALAGTGAKIQGTENRLAARTADLSVLAVPFAAHRSTLEGLGPALTGKILVDVTVPLVPPQVTRVQMPPEGSAAQQARAILGEGVEVAAAFQTISYEHLLLDQAVDCEVLVTGTSRETRAAALELVEAAGLTGWDAGPIENSVVVEGLTSVLIAINKKYGSTHAGIRITGVSRG